MSCTELFGFVLSDTLCGLAKRNESIERRDMLSKINSALQIAADVVSI